MSRIQYTKDQILALFSDGLPIPASLCRDLQCFVQRAEYPKLLINQTHQYHSGTRTRGRHPKKTTVKRDINPNAVAENKLKQNQHQAAIQSKPVSTQLAWYYLDQEQKIQGPFNSSQLRQWWTGGHFPGNLLISNSNDPDSFKEICEFFPQLDNAFSFNPMLFPFLRSAEPDPNDELQKVFLGFQQEMLS